MRKKTRNYGWHFIWGMLALVSFCFVGCKDDDEGSGNAFDPNKPVVVSDFLPKKGGFGQGLVVYGNNFGNDKSKVRVTIGGQNASIVNVKNESLYCFVPAKAYNGDIEVSILDDDGQEVAYAEAEEPFTYLKKMLVSSFLGETYDNNTKYDVKDGPFNDCGGFQKTEWLTFDPLSDNNILYATGYDKSTRIVDFEKQEVRTFSPTLPSGNGLPSISWTLDGDMIVTHDQTSETRPGNYLFTRSSNFTESKTLWNGRGIRTGAVHPVNGEVYYCYYNTGIVWRGEIDPLSATQSFKMPNSSSRVFIHIHPSGNYMYLVNNSRHYIMRSDYNWDTKNFTTPFLVAGKDNTTGWVDGVGANVRMKEPKQGVFVKNPNYAGQDDEYDFYFCDKQNHCIRIMTPTGRVSTYAGTPEKSGYRDGDLRLEAMFNWPESIAYDLKRQCFYVGDTNNHRIRKIALEE